MKLQYLGDLKDSFKWEYHHLSVLSLKIKLSIAWNISPDEIVVRGNSRSEEC